MVLVRGGVDSDGTNLIDSLPEVFHLVSLMVVASATRPHAVQLQQSNQERCTVNGDAEGVDLDGDGHGGAKLSRVIVDCQDCVSATIDLPIASKHDLDIDR